jgi:predicted ATPase
MSLAVNLQVTRGFAAPEVEEILRRALALCEGKAPPASAAAAKAAAPSTPPADARSVFAVLWGSWVYHKVRSDLHTADELALRLLILARDAADAGMLLQAHQAMAMTHLCLGNPRVAVDHMHDAAAVYDARHHAANTLLYGQDPGVATSAFGAIALCILDRAEEALAASERAMKLARSVSQPSSLAMALHFNGMLHQLRGAPAEAERSARAVVELAAEEGFSFWHAGSSVVGGWARASAGGSGESVEQAIAEIRRGLDEWAATGSRTYRSYYLGLLGDALLAADRFDEALRALDDAVAAAHALSEGLYEAELHRLRGHCLSRLARAREAEASFRQALVTARSQGARCFERRAASDLAAYLDDEGRPGEAQDVLAAVGGEGGA